MRAIMLGAAFVACAGALSAQPAEAYKSPEGKYAIKFPGKPKVTTPTAKSDVGDLPVTVASYATADASTYMVFFNDLPGAAPKAADRKGLFDAIRDGIKGAKGELVSEKDFEFGSDKLPGRELIVDKDKGKQRVRVRVVLRDSRIYQVVVIGNADFVAGKDATAFLESLELTK